MFMQHNGLRSKSGGIVMLTPDVGQGYLVLNKAENPDVETWVIEVNTRTFDQNNQSTDKTLDKVVLTNNINYWRVPETVSGSKEIRFIDVTGLDENNASLVTEGPIIVTDHPETALEVGGTPTLYGCSWLCNGSYYAWEIQQYVNPELPLAGPSRLVVETALNFNEALQQATPHYRYITEIEFQNECAMGGYFLPGVPCLPDGVWMTNSITVPFGTGASVYKDLNGQQIPGGTEVRGVGKPLVDWDGGNPIGTPELNFGMDKCGNDTWWAMDMVNNNEPTSDGYPMDGTGTSFYPELACNGIVSSGVSDPELLTACVGDAWDEFINNGLGGNAGDPTSDTAWAAFVSAVVDCLTADEDDDGDVLSWQGRVDKINITNLNDPSDPVIGIDPSDASTFSSGFTLQPGLYNFGFAVKGKGYVPMIFELEKKLTISTAMADFLSVTIYPVPIIDGKFNIDMTASEDLRFTYEFRDGTGKLLYEEKFSLKKGQQWKHSVAPKEGIPSGNHINRFVFADGSVLALQTIK
jgi:hypothetical protein